MDSAARHGRIEGFGHAAALRAEMHDHLTFFPPGARVAPWLFGFAHRYDAKCGDVVFELPELRPTVQIMLADDYWLRDRDDEASWAPVPRIALWGPRLTWGYGYAKRTVHAFGFGLTIRGFEDIIARPIGDFADRVVPLDSVNAPFARELERVVAAGAVADWLRGTTAFVGECTGSAARETNSLDHSLPLLAEDDGNAVMRASRAAGVGERHYRRLFQARYGISPRLYRRVLRIDRLLRRLHPAPWEKDEHAPELNFADQAHMIRECKALTGVTPGEYVRSKRAHGDATIRSVIASGIAPPPLA